MCVYHHVLCVCVCIIMSYIYIYICVCVYHHVIYIYSLVFMLLGPLESFDIVLVPQDWFLDSNSAI